MSSVRIHAAKSGGAPVAHPGAASRAAEGADPAAGFAAALGATTAQFQAPADPSSKGSGDTPTGRSRAGSDGAAEGRDAAAKGTDATADKDGSAAAPATLPGLPGFDLTTGDQATDGAATPISPRAPAKPAAAAVGVAATVMAASVVPTAAIQPDAAQPATAAVALSAQSQAVAAPMAEATTRLAAPVVEPVDALAVQTAPPAASTATLTGQPTVSLIRPAAPLAVAVDLPETAAVGLPETNVTTPAPKAASKGTVGDVTDRAPPAISIMDSGVSIATDAGPQALSATAADPSTGAIAASMSAPALIQAASPAHATQFDTAALTAVAAPSEMGAALVAPVAASAKGSGAYDFANTGRDAQAVAAAAFGGVATGGMGAPGGVGAASVAVAAAAQPAVPSADAGTANVAAQISGQVLRMLSNSGHEAVVRLYPPDLGEVTVRVAVSGRDVTAWFGSSQPDVQQTISLGLGQLQADLGNAGYSLNGAWVGADTSGSGPRGGSAPPPGAIAAAPAVPVTQAAAALSSTAGVSIYV